MDDKLWQLFTDAWLTAMLEFQSEVLSMEQAFDMIGKFSKEADAEIEQFACNTISEIGGFPDGYQETIALLKGNPSKQEVLNYMHS